MATIEFPEDGIVEEFDEEILLQDVIEWTGADIIFGCREGGCATCMIQVLEGMEHLSEPTMAEQATLEPGELEEGIRLACQITVTGEGKVVIEGVGL